MLIKSSDYIGSYVHLDKCPQAQIPEYAFVGRSNVGKSSLINYLCGRKALAKVSVTPGKTQTINYFLINNNWHLVDLPGFGYAKISRTQRGKWSAMTKNYFEKRKQLQYVFLLVDARIPPQKIDLEFANWMGEKAVPFNIIFTKADKAGSIEVSRNIDAFKKLMLEEWEELPPMFITSSVKSNGKEAILNFISQANKQFVPAEESV
jgi:GTP-binding protein